MDGEGEFHVAPASFRYNAGLDTMDIGDHNMNRSEKFRYARSAGRAAFVVEDVLPPWRPRGVEARGRAEEVEQGVNADFGAELIRLRPERMGGWGPDTDAYRPNGRSVEGAAG